MSFVNMAPLTAMYTQLSLLAFLSYAISSQTSYGVDFKKDIQPILKDQCYKCHSEESGKEKAGFVFDNLERFAKDIGPGRIIEPGDLANSHFFFTITSPEDDKAHMPPNKTLQQEEIVLIREWIKGGASFNTSKPVESPPMPAPTQQPQQVASIRTWTDANGRTIQAKAISIQGDKVVLEMADGKQYPYPIQKLSATDQAYIRSLQP